MLVDIDYDKICQEALTDVGAYAPGEAISSSDREAVTLRLSQMLTEEFLVKNLTERLKPLYGMRYETNGDYSKVSALDFALRPGVHSKYDTDSVLDRAKAYSDFLEGKE